jgi:lipopolysaccharide/colanic/teichoic acid biosynthesis glycosyltransferase
MPKSLLKKVDFYHTIESKTIKNGALLLVLDYDYFFQKRDFKILLNKFQKIFIVPLSESIKLDKDLLLKNEIISTSSHLTIIYNPVYQGYLGNKLEVNLNNVNSVNVKNVFDFCEKYLKKCYISDNVFIKNPNIQNLTYFGFKARLIKKSIDWIIGLSIYFLSQPLWLISAIKIHLESPGPIFFLQDRVGIRNNHFQVIKFRSMRTDAEANGAQFSKKNDSRIFPWGRTMRTTRIDELPQLFNIIKGELSLIGPRPERQIFIDKFEEQIPQYNERHAVKPGISGYAQIMYPYGAGVKDARHKLMYDLYYIKNWTPILEIKVLLHTIWTVIANKGI